MSRFKASYYTRAIPHNGEVLLFNGASGALVRLGAIEFSAFSSLLGPPRSNVAGKGLDEWSPEQFEVCELPEQIRALFTELLAGGFFIPSDSNEQAALKTRMEQRKNTSPLYVRIVTTMDCNYNCYYCFEDKSATYLNQAGCNAILEWIDLKFANEIHRSLFTDWFGGEPMLNQEAIEYISERAIRKCDERNIVYSSAITCNGSKWPEDSLGFVKRNRIDKIQFTLDGPSEHHNRRRKNKNDFEDTFQVVVDLIDKLHRDVSIMLRINVDPGIDDSVLALIPYFQERGWLASGARVYPYLALIGPMNGHCGQLDSQAFRIFRERFDVINSEFQTQLARPSSPEAIAQLPPFPSPMRIPCSAVAKNSVIFGPDGLMHKCVLDVGLPQMAHGRLNILPAWKVPDPSSLIVLQPETRIGSKMNAYESYDPFQHERCSKCQYLPVCMGGCPKDQFERNEFFLQERSAYWENNFERLVKAHADRHP